MFQLLKSRVMDKIGKTGKNIILVFIIQGSIAVFSLLTSIAVGRFYNKEILGYYSYFLSLTGLIALFAIPGVKHAVARLLSEKEDYALDVYKKSLIVGLVGSIVTLPLFWIVTNYLGVNPPVKHFFLFIMGFTVVNILVAINRNLLRGTQKIILSSGQELIARITTLVVIAMASLAFLDPYWVFLGLIIGFFVQAVFQGFSLKPYMKKGLKISYSYFSRNLLLFFFVAVSTVGIYAIDRLSISYVMDFVNLGQFEAFSNLINIIRMIAFVLPYVLIPMAVKSRYQIKKSFVKIIGFLFPFAVTIGALSFVFVPILFGQEFALPFSSPLPWLLVISTSSLVIFSFFNSILMGENQFSKGLLKVAGMDAFLSIVVNLGLNLFFIQKLGLIGAPIATITVLWMKILLNVSVLKVKRDKLTS